MKNRGSSIVRRKWWYIFSGVFIFCFSQVAFANISGKVFRDFNANGTFDSGASLTEVGVAGVTVKAFDADDLPAAPTATATTAANGTYSLAGLTGGKYRVEFSWADTGIKPSIAGGSSVQFVTDGASNADLALTIPDEYSHTRDPYVGVPTYANGTRSAASSMAAFYVFPYSATTTYDDRSVTPVTKATVSQLGSVWGNAYQRSSKTLYTSAVLRRFSDLGPLGTGGIYKIDMGNPTSPASGSLNYVDVKTLGIPTGNDPRDATACNKLASGTQTPAHDVAAWDQVGKIGIGGISMDNDHERLWLVNLADRKLYGINNIAPSKTPTASDVLGGYAITLPGGYSCSQGELRPWAVKYYRGLVYVGAVCDASGKFNDPTKLTGWVLRFNPDNAAAGFALEHTFSFAYNHPGIGDRNDTSVTDEWNGWLPVKNAIGWTGHHAPILTGIEFDVDGSLIIGILDRAGMQNGSVNYNEPSCSDSSLDEGSSVGDILRACKSGTGYLQDGAAGCQTSIPANLKTHNEFYWGDYGPLSYKDGYFNEIALGGLAFLPGSGRVMSIGNDVGWWYDGGVVTFNNTTGAADNRYFLYSDFTVSKGGNTASTMGKAVGLGDLELLSDPAPIQVGDRVWDDTDADGIQDANENGISGVTVELACVGASGKASTTTNSNGLYYFSNAQGGNAAAILAAGRSCTVRIPTAPAGKALTKANADGNSSNNALTDLRDSDAVLVSTFAEISFTVGGVGESNQTLDVGYTSSTTVVKTCPGPSGGTGGVGQPGQWTLIGNDSNPNDSNGFGQVGYDYSLLDRPVTIGEYLKFLNAADPNNSKNLSGRLILLGLVSNAGGVWATRDKQTSCTPLSQNISATDVAGLLVSGVSLNQAARYANWLATGDMNQGAYQFASSDGNANIVAIDTAWKGIRLPSENEYFKAAYWDAAKKQYNDYGTISLDGSGLPVKGDVDAQGYVAAGTHPYERSYGTCGIVQIRSGQGGKSAYGISNMVGGFHDMLIPNGVSGGVAHPVLRPDNQLEPANKQHRNWRIADGAIYGVTASGMFDSPSFRLAQTGDACVPQNTTNDLTLTKQVVGKPASGFGNPTYAIVLDCTNNSFDQTVSLQDGGSKTITGIPVGTVCTVTEPTLPVPPAGYSYAAPTFTPANAVTISAFAPSTVTVTNTLSAKMGSLSVTKQVLNKPAGFTSPDYNISVDCSDNAFDQALLLKDGETKTVANIPENTTCTVSETTLPTAPTGYAYGTPDISPATLSIMANQTLPVTVTNKLESLCIVQSDNVLDRSSPMYAVDNVALLSNDQYLYLPVHQRSDRPLWSGNLKKFRLNNGRIVNADGTTEAVDATGTLTADAQDLWSSNKDGKDIRKGGAANRLPAPDSRKLYTDKNDKTLIELKAPHVTPAMFGVTGAPERNKLLDFIRGKNADGTPRYHMGDSLNGKPQSVTYGTKTLVFFATNEGYLHAIDAATGVEQWAFMPNSLLQHVQAFYDNTSPDSHFSGLDGELGIWRFQYDSNGNGQVDSADQYRTYLYFGLREGGDEYYMLDVTDDAKPALVWHINSQTAGFGELGQTWSKPALAKMRLSSTNTENTTTHASTLTDVLVFGGGYGMGKGRNVFIVKAGSRTQTETVSKDGELLWSLRDITGSSDGLPPATALAHSIPGDIRVLDMDRNGALDRLYFADTGGNVWRVDMDVDLTDGKPTGADTWYDYTKARLSKMAELGGTGTNKRSFFFEPDVALLDHQGKTHLLLALGSGNLKTPLDTSVQDRFYLLVDRNPYLPASVEPSKSLFPVKEGSTLASIDDSATLGAGLLNNSSINGWFYGLPNSGEKVLASATTFLNKVVFTSFTPGSVDPGASCNDRQAKARAYVLDVFTGQAVADLDRKGGKERSVVAGLNSVLDTPQLVFHSPSTVDGKACSSRETCNHQGIELRVGSMVRPLLDSNNSLTPVTLEGYDMDLGRILPRLFWRDGS